MYIVGTEKNKKTMTSFFIVSSIDYLPLVVKAHSHNNNINNANKYKTFFLIKKKDEPPKMSTFDSDC